MNIFFGVDYYPEHWPRERWETDARLMHDMGIDVVRLAEFSWSKMEPSPQAFQFDWLEEAIALLAAYGIKTILGTPSAAPPAWVIEMYPDILPMDSNSTRCAFGGRHHDCQSNADYRALVKRFVTAMAERFAKNENVIGWQTDNELGNSHDDLCMCPSCTAAFQRWLERKYGDVGALNSAWGTYFWSQAYNSFLQISAPKHTVAGRNPSAVLDWKRFCSDLIIDFQQMQIDILRKHCPEKFITHNCMGFADKVNYFDLCGNLDFVSHDQYPGGFFATQPQLPAADLSAMLDYIRGVKEKSFWVMEQQSGITGWEILGRRPQPGQLALWAMHAIAHGADTVVFFRWRTCTVGTEQYWHGILPHSGKPGERYNELKTMIQKMRLLMPALKGAMPKPEAGVIYSYDQNFALSIQPHHPDLRYKEQVQKYYAAFYRRNVPVDFLSDQSDLSRYKLLIAPLQYLMTPALADRYKTYVQNGGVLVLTMRSGVKDEHNICQSETELPGLLSDLTGVEIPDYDCLRDRTVNIDWDGRSFTGEKWSDLIQCVTAESLARYASESYAGTPAVTVNRVGKGYVYYVGTEPDEPMLDYLAERLEKRHALYSFGPTPKDVEIVHRYAQDKTYIFVINHSSYEQTVDIPAGWASVVGDSSGKLAPFTMKVFTLAP